MKKLFMIGYLWLSTLMSNDILWQNTIKQDISNTLQALNINQISQKDIIKLLSFHINNIRNKNKLQELSNDTILDNVAFDHSKYLFETDKDSVIDYTDHFWKNWSLVRERITEAWFTIDEDCRWDCKWVWENIISANSTIENLVNTWMISEWHKKNILNPNVTHIGIAHYPWSNNLVVIFSKKKYEDLN